MRIEDCQGLYRSLKSFALNGFIHDREVITCADVSEVQCPGCGERIAYTSTGPVHIEAEHLLDGRCILRAFGGPLEFEIQDGSMTFTWGINKRRRYSWILHECSYGGGSNDRAAVPPPLPVLVQFAEPEHEDS